MSKRKGFSSGFTVLSGRSRRYGDLRKLLSQEDVVVSPPAAFEDFEYPTDYDPDTPYGTSLKPF
jgi:hypothetical protein